MENEPILPPAPDPAPPAARKRRFRPAGPAVALLLSAFVLRFLYLVEIRSLANYLILDSLYYYRWAERILAGDWIGDRIFDQSPLYAYFLALLLGLTRMFGFLVERLPLSQDPLFWIRTGQAAFGAVTCVLIVRVARRGGADRAEAGIAGVAAALYAPFLYYDTMVMKTFLASFLALLCLLFLYRSAGGRRRDLVLAGVLFGLTSLVRDNFILMFPILLAGLVPLLPRPCAPAKWAWWRPARRAAAWILAGAAIVILPVTMRNLAVGGEPALLTAGGGEVFYIGNNPRADGRYLPPCITVRGREQCVRADPQYEHDDFRRIASAIVGHEMSPMQSSRFWLRRGLGFVFSHPLQATALVGRKLAIFLKDREIGDNYDFHIFRRISRVLSLPLPTFGGILGLAAVGLVAAWPRRRRFALLYAAAAGYTATVLLFFNFSRFRIPAVPILLIFAGVGAMWLFHRAMGAARTAAAEGFPAAIRAAAILLVVVTGVASVSAWSLHEKGTSILVTAHRQVQLADLLRRMGRPRRALLEYDKVRYLVGDAPIEERRDLLGGTTPETFLTTLQEEKLQQALNFRIVHSRLYEGMGLARQELGDLQGAAADFEESIAIFLDGTSVLLRLAKVYEELGDLLKAAGTLDKALKIEESFTARFDMAGLLFRAGQAGIAYQMLVVAPDRNPDMTTGELADYHFGLGLILLDGLQQTEQARRHFETCLRLAPDHPQAQEIRTSLKQLEAASPAP